MPKPKKPAPRPATRPVEDSGVIKTTPRRQRGAYIRGTDGSSSAVPIILVCIIGFFFLAVGGCIFAAFAMVAGAAAVVIPAINAPAEEPDYWNLSGESLPEQMRGSFTAQPEVLGEPKLFPSTQSPYVAVEEENKLRVYDLRTLKPVGKPVAIVIPFIHDHNIYSLSPEGDYIAFGTNNQRGHNIEVWSVTTGQMLRRFAVDGGRWIGWVDFAAKDRLIVMTQEGQFPLPESRGDYFVYNVQTNQLVTSFRYDLLYHPKWGGLSNSRRYLVLEETNNDGFFLHAWDLTNGKKVAKKVFQPKTDPWGQACGIAFSPDGREMAMLWRTKLADGWGKIFVWDAVSGEKRAEFPVGEQLQSQDSLWFNGGMATFQWIPDGSGWLLFGHLLVDRGTGNVLGRVGPEPDSLGPRRRCMIDRNHITSDVPPFDKKLRVIDVPR